MTRKTEQVNDSSAETDFRIPNARDQASPSSISLICVITENRVLQKPFRSRAEVRLWLYPFNLLFLLKNIRKNIHFSLGKTKPSDNNE